MSSNIPALNLIQEIHEIDTIKSKLTVDEKIEIIKRRYGLKHGKGKRKRNKRK